ncbi:hypothetical protein B0H21DRAFT_827079 [Amylocystis lapponica]|nr:hypothetical protein B0H21DRAFT_827079 [Amylocystis lapponica]
MSLLRQLTITGQKQCLSDYRSDTILNPAWTDTPKIEWPPVGEIRRQNNDNLGAPSWSKQDSEIVNKERQASTQAEGRCSPSNSGAKSSAFLPPVEAPTAAYAINEPNSEESAMEARLTEWAEQWEALCLGLRRRGHSRSDGSSPSETGTLTADHTSAQSPLVEGLPKVFSIPPKSHAEPHSSKRTLRARAIPPMPLFMDVIDELGREPDEPEYVIVSDDEEDETPCRLITPEGQRGYQADDEGDYPRDQADTDWSACDPQLIERALFDIYTKMRC